MFDDDAFALADPSADGIVPRTAAVLRVATETYERLDLKFNIAKGRSEILLAFRGQGSKALWTIFGWGAPS